MQVTNIISIKNITLKGIVYCLEDKYTYNMKNLFAILLLTLGLSACVTSQSISSVRSENTPKQVVAVFLKAWQIRDVVTMYSQITYQSQILYTKEDFNKLYSNIEKLIAINDLDYTILSETKQGISASVLYNIKFDSTLFGQFSDTNRLIRLVYEDQWRIAWSPMDIFEGYTLESSFVIDNVSVLRGNIYDRNGQFLVKQEGTVSVLYVKQDEIDDLYTCQKILANILYVPLPELQSQMANYLPETLFYIGEIDLEVEQEYEQSLNALCSISRENNRILRRSTRQYYGQGAIVHITGHIGRIPADEIEHYVSQGYSRDALIGLAGIELSFESQLAGNPKRVLRIINSNGVIARDIIETQGNSPQSIYLTINRDLQMVTAQSLAWAFNHAINNWAERGRSPGGGAVVLDVKTGEILALASFPVYSPGIFNPDTYNPDPVSTISRLSDSNNSRQFMKNRVIQDQYSPGSTFKVITTVAAIEEGIINLQDQFYCDLIWDGREKYGDTSSPRFDWRYTDGLEATGDIVPSEALISSCDPFYYELGARLYLEISPKIISQYASLFGLGKKTDIDMLNEVNGIIPIPSNVDEAINNAIGQGNTQVTILQIAQMFMAVANESSFYSPYIVKYVGNSHDLVGLTTINHPNISGELKLNPQTIQVLKQGLCGVITNKEKGTAYWVFENTYQYQSPSYSVCGKTGTSQAEYAPHAWFVAFAPADEPEIVVAVMIQHSREGSEVAAPIVRRILDYYFGDPLTPYPPLWTEPYVPLVVPDGGSAGA